MRGGWAVLEIKARHGELPQSGLVQFHLCGAPHNRKGGDVPMLKFLLDRILPRDRPIKIALPQINNPHDATEALSAVTRAVAAGEIAPGEGAAVVTMVAGFARLVDISTFEKRIEALESEIMELRSKS